MNMYTIDNHGWGIPGFIRKNPAGGRGEETWFTLLVARRYIKGVPNVLEAIPPQPGESTPGDTAWFNDTSVGDSIFRCPSGLDHINNFTPDTPQSKTDGRNSWFWRRQSLLFSGVGASRGPRR